jgi:hypothetical protein
LTQQLEAIQQDLGADSRALVGLDLLFGEMADAAAFEALPADLTIDDAVREFALQHPEILERTKAFLRDGHSPWLFSELC